MAEALGPADLPPVELRGARMIKALTHPARLAVLEELFTGRPLTATEAAEIAGVSASAMSYHLRALEKAGIVKRAEPAADGRERPWQAAGSRIDVRSGNTSADSAASQALSTLMFGQLEREFADWRRRRPEEPPEWQDRSGMSSGFVWVTADELAEIAETVEALFSRFRTRPAPDQTDEPGAARRVRMAVVTIPER